jgi:hypothetical protein
MRVTGDKITQIVDKELEQEHGPSMRVMDAALLMAVVTGKTTMAKLLLAHGAAPSPTLCKLANLLQDPKITDFSASWRGVTPLDAGCKTSEAIKCAATVTTEVWWS